MSAFLQSLRSDLRFALRQLRRSPGFAVTMILTLALGVGSAAAIFSVIDAVLLQPLPFEHVDRLMFPDTHARSGYQQPWSLLSYQDARRQLKSFSAFAGYSDFFKINLESPSGPVSLQAVKGTDNFFDVFGVKPVLGRTFLPGEDQPGRDDVAVLSFPVWQTYFGGRADVIGKAVRMDGVPYTVIGVMPASFRFPLSVHKEVYTPLHADPAWAKSRGTHWMRTVALLKPGVTQAAGQADLVHVLDDLGRQYPDLDLGRTGKLIPLATQQVGDLAAQLRLLAMASLALLAIACVNVGGLLLARGIKREREMALRAAVGASRTRIVRQMLTESLVLSAGGLVGGVAVGALLLAAMRGFLDEAVVRGSDVRMNLPVLAAAIVLSGLTSLVASLAPAFRFSGTDPNRALRAGGASAGTGRGQNRLRSGFVLVQVALSLVLLVLSGLLLKNLHALLHGPLGFTPDSVLTEQIALSPGEYAGRDPLVSFYQPLLARVAQIPGVQAAGVIDVLPIENWGHNSDIHISGQPPYPPNQEMLAETRMVSTGYFRAMGIPLLRGRTLSPSQDPVSDPAPSIVVNQAFRRKFFPDGSDPVGAHLDESSSPTPPVPATAGKPAVDTRTGIVGVVGDVRQHLTEPALAERDFLVDQMDPKDRLSMLTTMNLVLRTSGDPSLLVAPLRSAMHDIDPTVPFAAPQTMTEVVSESLTLSRLESWLFGIFAALALLLSLIGIYGTVHHEVELRARDIGLRMALGATRIRVVRQILARSAALMAGGLALGWALTFAMEHTLGAVVTLKPLENAPLLLLLTAMLGLFGVLASLPPARRAASIDPNQTLRSE